ncbi:MAG: hypothetical protein ACE361_10465 [Aureliella sp.]
MKSDIWPRDYVETHDGLGCAVVSTVVIPGRYVVTPRYFRKPGSNARQTGWRKLAVGDCPQELQSLVDDSESEVAALGCALPVLDPSSIRKHYSARATVSQLLGHFEPADTHWAKAQKVLRLLVQAGVPATQLGITGSILIGAHHAASDLDFVAYSRPAFRQIQSIVEMGGELGHMSRTDWLNSFQRRAASISFEDYVWHESRKRNKVIVDGTKVDFGLQSVPESWTPPKHAKKLRRVRFNARVLGSEDAFDTPARWIVDWETAREVICWTATYVGQAFEGERVEVAGWLEETDRGLQVVVGTSREAAGEFIRVLKE